MLDIVVSHADDLVGNTGASRWASAKGITLGRLQATKGVPDGAILGPTARRRSLRLATDTYDLHRLTAAVVPVEYESICGNSVRNARNRA
jgi:hypothetical protein